MRTSNGAGQTPPTTAAGKGDWVRSMALAGHNVLYIGTNQGKVQRVRLPDKDCEQELWEQLWDNGRAEALTCLAVSTVSLQFWLRYDFIC